jgi:DNA-binding transcriptional ArsR family regulator
MDNVFKALADETRRTLLDLLHRKNGQTLVELYEAVGMTRQAVAKHLAILEEAGLVETKWQGREKLHYLNAVPLQTIYERWVRKFEEPRLDALYALKQNLEKKKR